MGKRHVCGGSSGIVFSKDIGLSPFFSLITKGTLPVSSFYIQ